MITYRSATTIAAFETLYGKRIWLPHSPRFCLGSLAPRRRERRGTAGHECAIRAACLPACLTFTSISSKVSNACSKKCGGLSAPIVITKWQGSSFTISVSAPSFEHICNIKYAVEARVGVRYSLSRRLSWAIDSILAYQAASSRQKRLCKKSRDSAMNIFTNVG